MPDIDNFKIELKELLEKYHANISCNIDGDTHGLLYEMVVDFGGRDGWKEYKLTDGNSIEHTQKLSI